MDKSDRAKLLQLMEERPGVEEWRATLTDYDRRSLNNPVVVWRKWTAATRVKKPKPRTAGASPSEHGRAQHTIEELQARVDDLTEELAARKDSPRATEIQNIGLQSEVEELKAKVAELEAATGEAGPSCNFCGKTQEEKVLLIDGIDASICHECVARCVETIRRAIQQEHELAATGSLVWEEVQTKHRKYSGYAACAGAGQYEIAALFNGRKFDGYTVDHCSDFTAEDPEWRTIDSGLRTAEEAKASAQEDYDGAGPSDPLAKAQ